MERKLRISLNKFYPDALKERIQVMDINGIRAFDEYDLVFVTNFRDRE